MKYIQFYYVEKYLNDNWLALSCVEWQDNKYAAYKQAILAMMSFYKEDKGLYRISSGFVHEI